MSAAIARVEIGEQDLRASRLCGGTGLRRGLAHGWVSF